MKAESSTFRDDFLRAASAGLSPESRDGGCGLYLLVDHGGAPGLMVELKRRPALLWSSLFADSREQGAIDVAPILIAFPNAFDDFAERELATWLHRSCAFSTSLVVLHSTLAHDELASALKRRLDVRLPDNLSVLLRYFDTRILESLLSVLTDVQCDEFMGIASRWLWLDRAGCLQVRDSRQSRADAWPARFELDVAQQNALIEAAEADALVEQMQRQAPDACGDKTRADLHALAAACTQKFGRLALEDVRTQTLFCLTALRLGVAFDAQAPWVEALERVAKKQISFEKLLHESGV